jgi:hypothetical protein
MMQHALPEGRQEVNSQGATTTCFRQVASRKPAPYRAKALLQDAAHQAAASTIDPTRSNKRVRKQGITLWEKRTIRMLERRGRRDTHREPDPPAGAQSSRTPDSEKRRTARHELVRACCSGGVIVFRSSVVFESGTLSLQP